MEYDGETRVRVMDRETGAVESLAALEVFDGTITISGGMLVVASTLGDEYLVWPVPDGNLFIRIYTNHSTEPDEIDVVVG